MFLKKLYGQQPGQAITPIPRIDTLPANKPARTPTPPGMKAPPASPELADEAISMMAGKSRKPLSGEYDAPYAGAVRPSYGATPAFRPNYNMFEEPNAGAVRPSYGTTPTFRPNYNMFEEPNAGAMRPAYNYGPGHLQSKPFLHQTAQKLKNNLMQNPEMVEAMKTDPRFRYGQG